MPIRSLSNVAYNDKDGFFRLLGRLKSRTLSASTIKTFAQKVLWNNLDFIVVDMPPGTGDTQLTFSQEIKIDGAIIISTPQEIALLDVKRGIKMFDKLNVKIIGLVDNMSHFETEDGKSYAIFGEGGVERTAKEFSKNFLGKIGYFIGKRNLPCIQEFFKACCLF